MTSLMHDIRYHMNRMINTFLTPIDRLFIVQAGEQESTPPPVFLIGPPRTGTTLLYQMLVQNFQFGYINNFVGEIYGVPNLATRLNKFLGLDVPRTAYSSDRGSTPGLSGPHEFGNFWYRWFPREPQYADETTLSGSQKQDLRNNVRSMTRIAGRPFIFKNVVHSVRIRALHDLFSGAVFLVMTRDPVFAAQSVYQVRKKIAPGRTDLWSVQPPKLRKSEEYSVLEQSVYQLYFTWSQIEEDARKTNPARFFEVSYESLCANPGRDLRELGEFLNKQGISVESRDTRLPELKASKSRKIPKSEFQEIVRLTEELWPQNRAKLLNL